MTNPLITEVNCATGEVINRQMTAEELEQFNKIKADQEQQAEAQVKAEADKAAAEAKLAALGLTADDLKALGL